MNANIEKQQQTQLKNNYLENLYKLSSPSTSLPIDTINLKEAMKKDTIFCKPCPTHKTENILYCFDCMIGICNYCRQDHQNHCLTVKNNFLLKPQLESFLFDKLDNQIKSAFEFSYPRKLYDFFYDKLDKHFKVLQESLEKYRIQKLKELNTIFEGMESSAKIFNLNYKKSKSTFKKFVNEGKSFFPSSFFSEVVFLQLFNVVNNGTQNEKRVLNEVKAVKQKTVQYEEDLTKALFDIEALFKDSINKISGQDSLVWLKNDNPFEEFNTVLEENMMLIEKFSSLIKKKKNKSNTVINNSQLDASSSISIGKIYKNSTLNEKKIQCDNLNVNPLFNAATNKSAVTNPASRNPRSLKWKDDQSQTAVDYQKVANPTFSTYTEKEKEKEEILLDKITNLKMYETMYINFIETGEVKINKLNLKDNSQISRIIEASEVRQLSNTMMARQQPKNINTYFSPQNKISSTYSVSNQLLNLLRVFADLCTNKNKLFRIDGGYPSSDGNNLLSAGSPLSYLEDEGNDYFQAISGTKTIQLYDFQNKKPYTVEIFNLNKDEYTYDVFPYGCRSFYINDKVYIIGGKDWNQEYKTILLYEVNSCKLVKCGDMINARSYHSILYSSDRKMLYIVGGERNNTCESFSLGEARTYPMPRLVNQRANTTLYLYKGIYLYAFCGFKDSIIEREVNSSFERLNLNFTITNATMDESVEFDENWEKVKVNNQSGSEIQFEYIGIMPFTDSHIFIYGGFDNRQVHRSVVVLDFLQHKLMRIDDKEFADLKLSLLYDQKFCDAFDAIFENPITK